LGGVAAAAYAGALPKPIQDFAHQTVGAPSADKGGNAENSDASEHPGSSAEPVGPDATGAAKYGLCTAFADEKAENGKVDTNSVAFRALAKAAGGADQIDAFCADAIPPGAGSGQTQRPENPDGDHPTGSPTDAPHGQPSGTPPVPDQVGNVPTGLPTGH
jgi:hypothetical protein